ncbi:hypothetical protein A2U01_0025404 [Trifolium medium]|uniref:Uncharacterized protein n=1 Tax=Trifolium medium TaxID=97028 RepID=A0A392NX18_9FABA|nr:hypothetical protein [Trifolium medium]
MGNQSEFEATSVNATIDDEINLVREDMPTTNFEKPADDLQGTEDEEDSDFDDTLYDYMD